MTIAPSEHPIEVLSRPEDEFYLDNPHDSIEQSAIYESVHFSVIGEPDYAIVLTSQCDIQGSSPSKYVLVSRIISVEEFILMYLRENGYTDEEALGDIAVNGNKKKKKAIVDTLLSSYMINKTFQYFFIPAFNNDVGPSMITFDVTQCISIGSLATHRKCAVPRSPFREAIPSHYSAYIGRIGTPRIDDGYLRSVVESGCRVVDP